MAEANAFGVSDDEQELAEDGFGWSDGGAPPAKRQRTRASTGTSRRSPREREIGIMRDRNGQGSAKFVGSASGIHFIRTVYSAFARMSTDRTQQNGHSSHDKDLVPGEDDQLYGNDNRSSPQASSAELWYQHELDREDSRSSLVGFETMIELTQSYFENWHPAFPFLHAPSTLKILDQVGREGINSVCEADSIIVRSITSLSLADRRQTSPAETSSNNHHMVPAHLVFNSLDEAASSLHSLLSQPESIHLLQAAVSVQIFLVSMLRLNTASRLGGLIVRMAFHLGLHRCPSRFLCFTDAEAEIRRRVFWSIYSLERHLSQSLGLPLDIKDDDIDVCYPGDELHDVQAQAGTGEKTKRPADDRLRFQGYLAKHAKIKGMILELRNKSIFHSHQNSDRATFINAEISKWWNEVHDPAAESEFDTPGNGHSRDSTQCSVELRPLHRSLLYVLKHEAIISLNRPLLTRHKSSSDYNAAFQICIASSRSIISALRRHMILSSNENASSPNDKGDPASHVLVWPSFTWVVWMSCFTLMYAALEKQFPVEAALKNADLSLVILENLSRRNTFWPGACATAVRDLKLALLNGQLQQSGVAVQSAPKQQPNKSQDRAGNGSRRRKSLSRPPQRDIAAARSRDVAANNHNEDSFTPNPAINTEPNNIQNPDVGEAYTQTLRNRHDFTQIAPNGASAQVQTPYEPPISPGNHDGVPPPGEDQYSLRADQNQIPTYGNEGGTLSPSFNLGVGDMANSWDTSAMYNNPNVNDTNDIPFPDISWQGGENPSFSYSLTSDDPLSIADLPWLVNEGSFPHFGSFNL